LGFADAMEKVIFDSSDFPNLKKKEQTKYLETVYVPTHLETIVALYKKD